MSDNQVAVEITANASGVAPATEEAKAQVNGLGAAIKGAGAGFVAAGKQSEAALVAIAVSAKETAIAVKEMGESIKLAREWISGIGEAMMAAFAVEAVTHWAEKMGEGGEKTEHTARMLGTSVGNVQQLNAAFTMMGVSTDKGVMGLMRLDKAFAAAKEGSKQQEAAFKELGISTAQNLNQMQLLGAVMDGFAKQADGPAKAAEAMALFGRSGAALIPFLDLGSAGLEELNRVTEQYGVVNDDAVAKAAQLGSAFNENHVAMQGLGNVMAQSFAPVLTNVVQGINGLIAGMIKSYKEGGAMKTVMDALVGAFKAMIVFVASLGFAIDEAFRAGKMAIDTFGDDWQLIADGVMSVCTAVIGRFQILGNAIWDALHGNLAKAGQDIDKGLDDVAAKAKAASVKINADLKNIGKDAAPGLAGMKKDMDGFNAWGKNLTSDKPNKQINSIGEGDDGDTSGDANKPGKAGGGKDRVAELQTEFEAEEAAHKGMLTNMQADELAYWQNVLATATLTKDQRIEIEKKVATEKRALDVQNVTEAQGAAKREAEETVASINSALATKKSAIAESIRLTEDQGNKGEISRAAEHDKIRQLIADEVAAEQDAAQKISAARVAADKVILASSMANTKQYKDAMADLVNQFGIYQAAMTRAALQGDQARLKDAQKTTDETVKAWTSATRGIVDTWVSGTRQMLQGTMTWQQFELKLWNQLLDGVVNMIEKMIMRWVAGEAVKLTTSKTSAAGSVSASAATAGAAGVASAAAIPEIGWSLAPAAGAADAAAAMSYLGLASASGGYDIPAGINPLTQLHAQEMVLPATLANPLRSMLAGGADGGFGGSGSGGDGHLHIHGAMDGADVLRVLRNNKDHVQTVMSEMMRSGKGRAMGIAAI